MGFEQSPLPEKEVEQRSESELHAEFQAALKEEERIEGLMQDLRDTIDDKAEAERMILQKYEVEYLIARKISSEALQRWLDAMRNDVVEEFGEV